MKYQISSQILLYPQENEEKIKKNLKNQASGNFLARDISGFNIILKKEDI